MQRSGGRNTHPERKRKKLKYHDSSNKDTEPGTKNRGNTKGDWQHQSGKGGLETEGQEQILPIPDKVPREGFDLEIPPEDMAKELSRDDQPDKVLMEATQL